MCEPLVKTIDFLYENNLLSPQDRAVVALRKACEHAAQEQDAAAAAFADEVVALTDSGADDHRVIGKMAKYLLKQVELLQWSEVILVRIRQSERGGSPGLRRRHFGVRARVGIWT